MKYLFIILLFYGQAALAQDKADASRDENVKTESKTKIRSKSKVMFGTASYYAEKFHGRKTANGEIFDNTKFTAACNTLPLGTWIRVTNLSNNRSVIVKTNDRLHPRMTRIVDLSRAAAEKLGYIRKGLTKVKVEVLEKKQ